MDPVTTVATAATEPDLWRFLASLGVGGAIAGLMFVFYRKDVKSFTDLWKGQSEQLTTVVKENTAAITQNTEFTKLVYEHLQNYRGGDQRAPFALPERRTERR